jgi:hypothetical protein
VDRAFHDLLRVGGVGEPAAPPEQLADDPDVAGVVALVAAAEGAEDRLGRRLPDRRDLVLGDPLEGRPLAGVRLRVEEAPSGPATPIMPIAPSMRSARVASSSSTVYAFLPKS